MEIRTEAYISLGSNTENARQALDTALDALRVLPDVRVARVSPTYCTEPQGYKAQPWFVNRAARLDCGPRWTAVALLRAMLDIETRMGRTRSADPALRFGPRCIDLDLLLFGTQVSEEPACILPHPRMCGRAFVLVPLRDIAPQVIIRDGKGPEALLNALDYTLEDDRIAQR